MQNTNLIQEYRNIKCKGAKIIITILGNEKELILCCINRERQELLAKTRPLQTKNEKTETICA